MRVVELIINNTDESPVFAMSIVNKPGMESNFVKLDKEEKKVYYAFSDDEQKIITGVAMIPNKMIYRNDIGDGEEGYVYFSEETVRECAYLFLANNKNNETTLGHDKNTDGLRLIESWVVEDPEYDKSTNLKLDDVVKVTWLMSYKVTDNELWEKIKKGEFNGFSLEGNFSHMNISVNNKDMLDELLDIFNDMITD